MAFPGHERDEQVASERKLAHVGARSIGQNLTVGNRVALTDDRTLVDARALVRASELVQVIGLVGSVAVADGDEIGADFLYGSGLLADQDVAAVGGRAKLNTGADERCLASQQRHRLALHVGAHESSRRVVVLEERDERSRDGDDLTGRDVHVVDLGRLHVHDLTVLAAAQDVVVDEFPVGVEDGVGLRLDEAVLAICREVVELLGHTSVDDLAIRRLDEPVVVDAREARQRPDQSDVRTFRRLDRAHASVVGRVDVANFDAGALTRQTTGSESGQTAKVREAVERVRLLHELRELRSSEELLDRCSERTDVDQRLRRYRFGVLCRHALFDDALHTGQADADLVGDELADERTRRLPKWSMSSVS